MSTTDDDAIAELRRERDEAREMVDRLHEATTMTAPDAWKDQVEQRGPRDCWPWVGRLNHDGYGAVRVDGKQRLAHVLALEETHGEMRPGELARHMCFERSARRIGPTALDDRRCCNPAHLIPGSVRANAVDRERSKGLERRRATR